MSDMDPIAAARALIEPLTGYTPEPWEANINEKYGFIMVPLSGYDGDFKPEDARLIAAAPALRDMVATLADAMEAERAKIEALRIKCANLAALEEKHREQANAEFHRANHEEAEKNAMIDMVASIASEMRDVVEIVGRNSAQEASE